MQKMKTLKKKVLYKKIGNEVLKIDSRKMIAESVINNEKKNYKIIEIVYKPYSSEIKKVTLAA